MKRTLTIPRFRQRVLVRPQNQQLTDENGQIAVDFVGRYEDLQASYDTVCEQIGLPTLELGRKNPSKHDDFTNYYDDELRDVVSAYYADDLKIFDYQFPSI